MLPLLTALSCKIFTYLQPVLSNLIVFFVPTHLNNHRMTLSHGTPGALYIENGYLRYGRDNNSISETVVLETMIFRYSNFR
jgi:hypothetical protein